MSFRQAYLTFICCLPALWGTGQEPADHQGLQTWYIRARELVREGEHTAARNILEKMLLQYPADTRILYLLARTHSWDGDYDQARREFNKITSVERDTREFWLSAIKNELYAGNDGTALGLANKALKYLAEDTALERLRNLALENIHQSEPQEVPAPEEVPRKTVEKAGKALNTLSISNALMVFDIIYDPMVYSSVEYKRRTRFGSVIPRINYSNRFNINGIQYDLDLYPKFSKRMYAYLNYGYSEASIYPNHKTGGDVYYNFPWAIEASAGVRYVSFDTRKVTLLTNSIGWYRGNYYVSFRSYITPKPNQLTRVSGNLLVRKYFRDAENYFGIAAGMGYSPELRQLVLDGTLLSETLLYLESQRINMEYQFTGRQGPNIYKARLGIARQELATSPGDHYVSILGGFTYKLKF